MNDVFISYSRRNKDFTQKLYKALTEANRTVWADWDSIPATSDWLAEIKQGIEETQSVLFVISPEWIKSAECRKELNHAIAMNKRLLPVLYQPIESDDLPPELAKINWIYMRDADDFGNAFHTLCSALDTDLDWVKTHTRIQIRALEWDKKKRDQSFALRGKDLTDAEQFIANSAGKNPEATRLQGEYILASRKDANWRQRMILAGVTVALIISIALGIIAIFQREAAVQAEDLAQHERDRAVAAEATAVANEKEAKWQAKIARTGELSAQSTALRDRNFQVGLLLGLEAYKNLVDAQSFAVLMDNAQAYPQLRSFADGHTTWTNSLDISPDGKFLAFTGNDNSVILLDIEKGQPVRKLLNGHGDYINSVSFSPNGKTLASGSNDKTVILWDVATGQRLGQPLTGHTEGVTVVSFSPDGKILASASKDKTIIFWDAKTGKQISQPLTGHTLMVDSLAFNANGTILASGDDAGEIFLWDVATRQQIGKPLVGNAYYATQARDPWINSLSFSPDGKILASASQNGSIILWDMATLHPFGEPLTKHNSAVNCVAFSPDGKTFATGGDDHNIILWDVATRQPIGKPLTSNSMVYSVAFSPDGKILASNNRDNTIILWDVKPRRLIQQADRAYSIAFSPDGKMFASSENHLVILWDAVTGQPLGQPLEGHTDHINSVAFSPNGKILAAGSEDKNIILWDVNNPNHPSQLATLSGHNAGVNSVAFSPDGKTLASAGGDKVITLWDVATGKQIGQSLKGHTQPIRAVAFSPDGKILASGGEDRNVILWNVGNLSSPTKLATLSKHSLGVYSIAFSPDGKMLATGGSDMSIIVWNVATLQPIGQPFIGHTSRVYSLAFSPDSKILASGSFDKTIILWDLATHLPLGEPLKGHSEFVRSVAISPDGKTLASGSDDATILLWDIDLQSWLKNSCQRAGRNFTRAEWEKYFPDDEYRKTCGQWPLESALAATP